MSNIHVASFIVGGYPGDLERVTFPGARFGVEAPLSKMEEETAAEVARELAKLSLLAGILQDPVVMEKGFASVGLSETDGKGTHTVGPMLALFSNFRGPQKVFFETFFLSLGGLDAQSLQANEEVYKNMAQAKTHGWVRTS